MIRLSRQHSPSRCGWEMRKSLCAMPQAVSLSMGSLPAAALALACLILGSVVSYAKARAEGLGMTANVGIAERADRLVVVLLATGLVGWFLPEIVLTVVLALLALASLITVVQRMLEVRRQALDLV